MLRHQNHINGSFNNMAEQQVSPGSDFLKAHVDAGCDRRVQLQTPGGGMPIRREIISSDEVTES